MPRFSVLVKKLCPNNYFVKASTTCAKGYVCKLDPGKVVYPNSCRSMEAKHCWRVNANKKCGTS